MPDFAKVEALTVEAENQVRAMIDAVRLFRAGKVVNLNLIPTQKTEVRTRYTDALAALKVAVVAIDKELVS